MIALARLDLIETIRRSLEDAGDAEKAAGQQAYMKSEMPYRGVASPVMRAAFRSILGDPAYRIESREAWLATVRVLWDDAGFREERYAALALAEHRFYRAWATETGSMELYRYLVETGAWWDFVDEIAMHLVGPVLLAHPETEKKRMRDWAIDSHLWIRRTAILSQRKFRERTDRDLLIDCIEANLVGSEFGNDFFIRKAIGWALREQAKAEPDGADWVKTTVDSLGDRLSPLSQREALKHL